MPEWTNEWVYFSKFHFKNKSCALMKIKRIAIKFILRMWKISIEWKMRHTKVNNGKKMIEHRWFRCKRKTKIIAGKLFFCKMLILTWVDRTDTFDSFNIQSPQSIYRIISMGSMTVFHLLSQFCRLWMKTSDFGNKRRFLIALKIAKTCHKVIEIESFWNNSIIRSPTLFIKIAFFIFECLLMFIPSPHPIYPMLSINFPDHCARSINPAIQ